MFDLHPQEIEMFRFKVFNSSGKLLASVRSSMAHQVPLDSISNTIKSIFGCSTEFCADKTLSNSASGWIVRAGGQEPDWTEAVIDGMFICRVNVEWSIENE